MKRWCAGFGLLGGARGRTFRMWVGCGKNIFGKSSWRGEYCITFGGLRVSCGGDRLECGEADMAFAMADENVLEAI